MGNTTGYINAIIAADMRCDLSVMACCPSETSISGCVTLIVVGRVEVGW